MLLWAAFDWRGEQWPYDWPAINCQFGVMDTCGFAKDKLLFLPGLGGPADDVLHLLPHWNWAVRDKEPIVVRAYTNFDEVELFLNDQSQGRKARAARRLRRMACRVRSRRSPRRWLPRKVGA